MYDLYIPVLRVGLSCSHEKITIFISVLDLITLDSSFQPPSWNPWNTTSSLFENTGTPDRRFSGDDGSKKYELI